jgi:amphi-Trp domain-containing protein
MVKKKDRDVEKGYTPKQFAAKLRRLAEAVEGGGAFSIQVAGEAIRVPKGAIFNVEHEREGRKEEVEFQVKWEISRESE